LKYKWYTWYHLNLLIRVKDLIPSNYSKRVPFDQILKVQGYTACRLSKTIIIITLLNSQVGVSNDQIWNYDGLVKVLRKKKAQIRKIATSQRRAHTEIPSVACKGGRQVAHRESPERHFYQIQMLFNPSLPAQNRGLMKGTWSSFLSYH